MDPLGAAGCEANAAGDSRSRPTNTSKWSRQSPTLTSGQPSLKVVVRIDPHKIPICTAQSELKQRRQRSIASRKTFVTHYIVRECSLLRRRQTCWIPASRNHIARTFSQDNLAKIRRSAWRPPQGIHGFLESFPVSGSAHLCDQKIRCCAG